MSDVLLACMPFGPVFQPSIALSLLKAVVEREGIAGHARYFSIDFAERIGQAFYCGVASEGPPPMEDLAGEWIFASELFPSSKRAVAGYVKEVLRRTGHPDEEGSSDAVVKRILDARRKVASFLDDCTEEVLRESPRLVGFTSVFQQHVASLALARRIKQERPEITVVMGGANCEGVMGAETVRQFPFVDAAVSGEGEIVFPELVRRALAGQSLRGLPGVLTPPAARTVQVPSEPATAPAVTDLDALPYPDYGDFFRQFDASRYRRTWQPSIFFETSRGCWWGERMHCTFCGLNGGTMAYRSKSPRRALAEIVHLTETHPDCDVEVTDNILDMQYFGDLLPELGRRRLGASLYWETKANLRKEQLRILKDAGIRILQPGIESFSDSVLQLMRKGVSGLQNIQVLKWCREIGIEPYWNILWGFPGEPPEDYARIAQIVPLLTHLTPPLTYGAIRLDRFSPNFVEAEQRGFVNVAPITPYRHIYPLPDAALRNLACYFRFDYREPRDLAGYVEPLEEALEGWTRAAGRSDLFSVPVDGRLLVWDLRPAAREPLTVLDGIDRQLYQACDRASGLRELARGEGDHDPGSKALEEVEARLEPLVESGLVLRDGRRYLALAVPVGDQAPKADALEPFRDTLRELGRRVRGGFVVPVNGGREVRARVRRGARRSRRPAGKKRRPAVTASSFSFESTGELFVRLGRG